MLILSVFKGLDFYLPSIAFYSGCKANRDKNTLQVRVKILLLLVLISMFP
jgi:hypothetical protein